MTRAGTIAVTVTCAFLAGATFGICVLDFGAHADGPGIGLEWSRPLGGEYGLRLGGVLLLSVVQGTVSVIAFGRTQAKPFGVLALPALGFVGMIAGFVGFGRALPAWWKWGCSRGHAYACYAAGGVTDGAESDALDARACAGDVGLACSRIARSDPARKRALCADRDEACRAPSTSRALHGRCNVLEEVCRE